MPLLIQKKLNIHHRISPMRYCIYFEARNIHPFQKQQYRVMHSFIQLYSIKTKSIWENGYFKKHSFESCILKWVHATFTLLLRTFIVKVSAFWDYVFQVRASRPDKPKTTWCFACNGFSHALNNLYSEHVNVFSLPRTYTNMYESLLNLYPRHPEVKRGGWNIARSIWNVCSGETLPRKTHK